MLKVSTVLNLHGGVRERKRVLTISFTLNREVRASERGEKETKLFMMFSSPWGPAPDCYLRTADL